MLERDILHEPAFLALVADRAKLVTLDFPRRKKQDEAVKTRNAELKKKYGNERGSLGFPTLVMIKPDGTELTRRGGYSPAGKAEWYQWLRESLDKHAQKN
jgi:hypothetical protein